MPASVPGGVSSAGGTGLRCAFGLADLVSTLQLGISFEMNGRDVTLLALGLYGSTFATAGLLFGLVLEGRRRDRAPPRSSRHRWRP